MNEQLYHDLQHIERLVGQATQQGLHFLNHLNERSTRATPLVDITQQLPVEGLGAQDTLALFNQKFESLLVASSGPRFWGFVTGGVTPAALMGDMLTSFYDQNTQAIRAEQGDLSANIELETIALFLDLLGLPNDFWGGFVTGATLSNFTCLAIARQWLGQQKGIDVAKTGMVPGFSVLSASPHSSSIKCLSMLGIGSQQLQTVKMQEGNREAMDMEDLQRQIEALNGDPFMLISSAGTVNTVDYDDFTKIAALKSKYNFWWHIDGAFGAFAACSPRSQHLVQGWAAADSITVDGHKWLNVPYESAVFFVKEKYSRLQMETFQNSNAPYLGNPADDFNYLNLLPENSRRLRALPAWFTLRAYGKKGYQEIVEQSIDCAHTLGDFISASDTFELLAPVRLNTVCFSLASTKDKAEVSAFLSRLNATGKVFMTPTVYKGTPGIRAAFVNWRTTKADVQLVIQLMKAVL